MSEPFVNASIAPTASGYAVHLFGKDTQGPWTRKVLIFGDEHRANHVSHVMVSFLRERLNRGAIIEERDVEEARHYAESLRTTR